MVLEYHGTKDSWKRRVLYITFKNDMRVLCNALQHSSPVFVVVNFVTFACRFLLMNLAQKN
jgi:hypothetical protein